MPNFSFVFPPVFFYAPLENFCTSDDFCNKNILLKVALERQFSYSYLIWNVIRLPSSGTFSNESTYSYHKMCCSTLRKLGVSDGYKWCLLHFFLQVSATFILHLNCSYFEIAFIYLLLWPTFTGSGRKVLGSSNNSKHETSSTAWNIYIGETLPSMHSRYTKECYTCLNDSLSNPYDIK